MIPPRDSPPTLRDRSHLSRPAGTALLLLLLLWIAPAASAAGDTTPDISLSGTLSASLSLYESDGRPASREPSSWTLRGAPTLRVYGIDVPLNLVLTEQDRDFRQPLNRLGAHPRLGWATGHAGYSSLSWSPYSLAGQSILGVGVEGAPGRLRFGVLAGRLRRTVAADSVAGIGRVAPVYERNGYALRFGVGAAERRAGIVVVRGGDDEHSLSATPATVVPQENLVVSVGGRYRLTPQLALDCELAQSAYTEDKLSSLEGGYDGLLLRALGFFMGRRASTRESQALEAKLGWVVERGGVDVVYKRIDPGYRSMGANFFNGDLENITFEPTLKLANSRLRLAGSLGFQHDNLDDGKDVETTRTIGSGRVDWIPNSVYLANLSYANYSLDQKAGRSPLDSTATKLAQSTGNLGLTQTLTLVGDRVGQSAVLVWSRQDMEDRTENGSFDTSYTAHQINALYTFTWVPWGLSLNAGYSRSTYDVAVGETEVAGPQLGADLSFWNRKASLGAGASLTTTGVDGNETVGTSVLQIRGALRPAPQHRFTLRFSVHENDAKTAAGADDTETRGEIGYAYSF